MRLEAGRLKTDKSKFIDACRRITKLVTIKTASIFMTLSQFSLVKISRKFGQTVRIIYCTRKKIIRLVS